MAKLIYDAKAIEAYWGVAKFTSLRGWSSSLTADTADSTVAGAGSGRTKEVGFLGGTATVTCLFNDTDEMLASKGAVAVLELLRDATNASKGYKGPAVCTDVSIGQDKDGHAEVTYSFLWSDTVTATVTKGTA